MGMPNAYKCKECNNPEYFPGTTNGHQDLINHYRDRHNKDRDHEKNAYQCHFDGCDAYAPTECEMIEHYRTH